MARLSDRDVQDILDLLENEVDTLSRMSSVERMKMRSKIRRQSTWLLEWNDPSAENILQKLQWLGSLSPNSRLKEILERCSRDNAFLPKSRKSSLCSFDILELFMITAIS